MLKACSKVKILKMKKECYFHAYGAMISVENLENQTSTSKNHILGLKGDTDVKLALISITLAAKKKIKCIACCICKVSILVGDRYSSVHKTFCDVIATISWAPCMQML